MNFCPLLLVSNLRFGLEYGNSGEQLDLLWADSLTLLIFKWCEHKNLHTHLAKNVINETCHNLVEVLLSCPREESDHPNTAKMTHLLSLQLMWPWTRIPSICLVSTTLSVCFWKSSQNAGQCRLICSKWCLAPLKQLYHLFLFFLVDPLCYSSHIWIFHICPTFPRYLHYTCNLVLQ